MVTRGKESQKGILVTGKQSVAFHPKATELNIFGRSSDFPCYSTPSHPVDLNSGFFC